MQVIKLMSSFDVTILTILKGLGKLTFYAFSAAIAQLSESSIRFAADLLTLYHRLSLILNAF